MSIVKVLVPLSGGESDHVALATAFQAAKPFNAHVQAVFVCLDPRESVPYGALMFAPNVIQNLVDAADSLNAEARKAARASLDAEASKAEARIVPHPQRSEVVTASFSEMRGHLANCLEDEAELSDVIVFPPLTGQQTTDAHDGFIDILTRCGRPVLLSPMVSPKHIGRNIALGWDGGNAAAHALMQALPYLYHAETVNLIAVRNPQNGADPGSDSLDDVGRYLLLHGIESTSQIVDPHGRSVADALLEAVMDSGCDLLVIGGYGHSRGRETIFGGVTVSIASLPLLPILMVH